MKGFTDLRRSEKGLTLLELVIAAVVMAIIFLGLISSITRSFMAANNANMATKAQATARQMLEEARQLSYDNILMLDGSALITEDGLAGKYQVFETIPGLLTLEAEVCRPVDCPSLAELAAMEMTKFHQLVSMAGSRIRFTTLTIGLMERAEMTHDTTGDSGIGDPFIE